jgi:Glycosyl transferase family 2/Galactose-3-O-sulfotransferase
MRMIAVLATYNEERFISACLEHLLAQGVDVYLIDNASTDRTVEIAQRYLRRGLIGIETLPRDGAFTLRAQLQRKEALCASLDADWLIHVDADEIRLPPSSSQTLAQAFAEVQAQGYNAVNFIEYTFIPTREAPDHDHPNFQQTMRWYYPYLPRFPHRLNAWKQQPGPVDLVSSGGHQVRFAGLRMYPESFKMRHYLFLSVPHAIEKYIGRGYDETEVAQGWHGWRPLLRPEKIALPSSAVLRTYVDDDHLDASNPRRKHVLDPTAALTPAAERAQPLAAGSAAVLTPGEPNEQIVFIHLPKTAGTSFVQVLEQHFSAAEICPAYFHDELARIPVETLARYRLFRGHFFRDAIAQLPLPAPVWITFLRDPVERVLSTYAHMQNYPDLVRHPYGSGKTLEEYLDDPLARAHVTNLQTRRLAARLEIGAGRTVQEAIQAETERVLAGRWPRAQDAIEALDSMAFFGLAERFDDSLALLAYALAWQPLASAPRVNVAPRRLLREEVPARLLDRILDINQEDLKLYAYAQRAFAGRFSRMLHTLLEDHYERHGDAPRELVRELTLDFARPLPPSSGWYDPESDGQGRSWRWTGPQTISTLDLPLAADGDLALRFSVVYAIAPDVLASLSVRVNGSEIALERSQDERGAHLFWGVLPQAALASGKRCARLDFEVSHTVVPAAVEPGSADQRPLGIALAWLAISAHPDPV